MERDLSFAERRLSTWLSRYINVERKLLKAPELAGINSTVVIKVKRLSNTETNEELAESIFRLIFKNKWLQGESIQIQIR